MKMKKLRNKIYYILSLSDDRWYNYRKRWWYDCNEPGNKSTNQEIKTEKKVNKVLRRLEHEKYKGKAYFSKHIKHVDERGHLWENWEYNFGTEKWG